MVVAHGSFWGRVPNNTRLSTTQCAAVLMCDRIEQPLGQGKIGSEAVGRSMSWGQSHIKSDLPIANFLILCRFTEIANAPHK